MYNDINEALSKCQKWATSYGLNISAEKTSYMLFTQKRTKSFKIPEQGVTLNGVKIDKDTQVRYLGVIIDQKLKWHKHIDNRLGSVKRQLFALRNYIGKTCGPSPKMIKYAYTNILRPKLLYACFIFEAELTKGQKQS